MLNEKFHKYCPNSVFLSTNKFGPSFNYYSAQCVRCFEKEENAASCQDQKMICKDEDSLNKGIGTGWSSASCRGREGNFILQEKEVSKNAKKGICICSRD